MNVATDYLGLRLRNPFVVGASPLCDHVHTAWQLQDAGAAALVMRSLFAEQFDSTEPAVVAEPGVSGIAGYVRSPARYLRQLALLKGSLAIPVIASLNGCAPGDWIDFAHRLEGAGADAIEFNCYQVVTGETLGADQIETGILRLAGRLVAAVNIPVAVKLSPYHTAVAQLATALELEGVAGLVLFNRFLQPDLDVEALTVQSAPPLSDSSELLLRLRWLAILSPRLRGSLAASGGVHTGEDTVKALLTGAHAVQLVSVLLRHGPNYLGTLARGLQAWMHRHGHGDLAAFRGQMNLARCTDAAAFERAHYVRALQNWVH